jgi:intron-binding protein aquarius
LCSGKTDTAVQIISEIYHNFPDQRTLLITHSNNALNDLFAKIMERDIDERYLLRLGRGSEDIATESDMGKFGRVNYMLQRRLTLLEEVARLARSLRMSDDVAYTCETSGHFFLLHVLSRWEKFVSTVQQAERASAPDLASIVHTHFPFAAYFQERVDKQQKIWAQYYAQQTAAAADAAAATPSSSDAMEVDGAPAAAAAAASPAAPSAVPSTLFRCATFTEDMSIAVSCFADLQQTFVELEETRPFELLRTYKDRSNYLLSKHAKIIAMTCTHAAIKREDLVALNFRFDNLVMEESAQILEIETFIPLLLQRNDSESGCRLKRVCLLGDHHQLPPVIKNRAFQRFSHMDQSLFTRFIRLGMPYVQLNAQGRMRASLASLWNWQYNDLGNLPFVHAHPAYLTGNVGFAHEYQLINVEDLNGVGESAPTPFF